MSIEKLRGEEICGGGVVDEQELNRRKTYLGHTAVDDEIRAVDETALVASEE